MEGAKTKIILTALVISVIVVASIGFYLIKDEDDVVRITALEGKIESDVIAKEWHNDSIIVAAVKHDNVVDGKCSAWYYKYYSPSTGNEIDSHPIYDCVYITIYSNGSHSLETFQSPYAIPIENWTIDSDDAFEIAISNPEVKSFLQRDTGVFLFQLSNDSIHSVWQIEWCYDAGFDNPKWAEIHIDASTGEVLYVEADN